MCVIFLVDQTRPTMDMVEKAWKQNDDGGGVAWRDTVKGKRVVRWKKGIESVEEMKDLAKTLPTPYIMHYRIASVGGVRPQLTHPFPIDKSAPLSLKGHTDGYVLFHNGDWRGWSETARAAAVASNTPIPVGKWSDTRAMAWLCSIYGPGFMEFLPEQKGIAFGPDDMDIFTGNGWTKVEGVWCSNDYFQTRMRSTGYVGTSSNNRPALPASSYHYCRYRTCTTYTDLDKDGYCKEHAKDKVVSSFPTETGGSQAVTPFPQGLLTVRKAEELAKTKDKHGNKLLSKGKLRKVRKLWSVMASKNSKRAAEAKEELMEISLKATQSTGSVH